MYFQRNTLLNWRSSIVPAWLLLVCLACTVKPSSTINELPTCFANPRDRMVPLNGSWENLVNSSTVQGVPRDLYWNYTCSLEWSKYSCVHQGFTDHALAAASWKFTPSNCELLNFNGTRLARLLRGRKVYFVGDSMMRQLFISLACRLEKEGIINVNDTFADWPICPFGKWPCQRVKGCKSCGPHSGFHEAIVTLSEQSTSIAYDIKCIYGKKSRRCISSNPFDQHSPHGQLIHRGLPRMLMNKGYSMSADDIILIQPGVGNTATKQAIDSIYFIRHMFHTKMKLPLNDRLFHTTVLERNITLPKVVWLHAWQGHFPTLNGIFNPAEMYERIRNSTAMQANSSSVVNTSLSNLSYTGGLNNQSGAVVSVDIANKDRRNQRTHSTSKNLKVKSNNARVKPDTGATRLVHNLTCSPNTTLSRMTEELAVFNQRNISHMVDAMFSIEGVNKLGNAKVGMHSGLGDFGDCVHFCMPGPVDEVVRVFYTLLVQLLS